MFVKINKLLSTTIALLLLTSTCQASLVSSNLELRLHSNLKNIELKKTTITKSLSEDVKSSSIDAKSVLLNSSSDITLQSSSLLADDSINLNSSSGDINIVSTSYTNYYESQTSKSSFGGLSKSSSFINDTTHSQSSSTLFSANNINLKANNINILASKIKSDSIEISADMLNLISSKETNSHTEFKTKSGIFTATIHDKGKITEVEIPSIIEVDNKLIVNDKDITDKLDIKTYKEISNSLNSDEFKDSILNNVLQKDTFTLSSSSNAPLNIDEINQIKATLNSKEWDEKTTTLSGIGSLVVTAVVTYLTAGSGSSVASSLGMSSASTTYAVTQAVTTAVIANTSVQATNMIVSGGKVKFDIDSLAKSALSAGVGSMASSYISNIDILKDTSLATNNSSFLNLDSSNTLHFSYHNLAKAGLNSLTNSAISSGIYGTKFKDNLISNLAFSLSDSLYKAVGDYSSNEYNLNSNEYFKDGSLSKIALHSLTGASISALTDNDILAGALSAGVNEALSPLLYKDTSKFIGTQEDIARQKEIYHIQRNSLSSLIGTISGGLIDGESGASIGSSIATSADRSNRQLHQEEIDLAKAKSAEYARLKGISEDEAYRWLIIAGASNVDILHNYSFNQEDENIAEAKKYLEKFKNQTFIDKKGEVQNYFVAKDRDYYKPYVYLYETDWGQTRDILQSAYYQSPYETFKDKTGKTLEYISNNKLDTAKSVLSTLASSAIDCIKNPMLCASNTFQSIGNNAIDGSYGITYASIPSFRDDLNSYYGYNASDYLYALSTLQTTGSFLEAAAVAGGVGAGKNILENTSKGVLNKVDDIANSIDDAFDLSKYPIGNVGDAGRAVNKIDTPNSKNINTTIAKTTDEKALAKQTEIKELFDKDNDRKGITIGNTTYLADTTNKGGAKVFTNVSDGDIFNYFKELGGVDKMPDVKKVNIADKTSDLYSIKTDKGSFTLRNNSKSKLPNGKKPKWTIDIKLIDGKKVSNYEIKFEWHKKNYYRKQRWNI